MNPELQKARQHYDTLPPNIRERATAKHLLAVIQIAERHNEDVNTLIRATTLLASEVGKMRDELRESDEPSYLAKRWTKVLEPVELALARVSKPEAQ